MEFQWKQDAIAHAKKCEPEESCGIVAIKNNEEKYYPCKNISFEFKAESFVIDPLDWANVEDSVDQIVGIVHSHPQDILEFSESDKYSCKAIDLTFYLVSPKSDKMAVIQPDEIDA
jgi:proteasome lid subunit RPN8/RPN11|tara:strand:- start:4306 stop:4653 length:348 start_codon:yes stop_codon:yes gene_type:complete